MSIIAVRMVFSVFQEVVNQLEDCPESCTFGCA